MPGDQAARRISTRDRKTTKIWEVSSARGSGFRHGSAAERAAGGRTRQTVHAVPAQPDVQFHPGSAGSPGGRQRRSGGVGGSPAKRRSPQTGGVQVEELDAGPPPADDGRRGTILISQAAEAEAEPRQRNHIRLYVDRDKVTAAKFQLRLTGQTTNEELTTTARSNLLLELATSDEATRHAICQHYRVHPRTAKKLQQKWRQRATVRSATRPGRPSIMDSPGHKQGLREVNRDNRAAGVRKQSEASRAVECLRGGTIPGTNKRRRGVSPNTIWRWKKLLQYVTHRTKWRPKIVDDAHKQRRMTFAQTLIDWDESDRTHDWFDGDEKVFTIPKAKKICAHPDSDVEEIEKEAHPETRHKGFIPHVMVATYISKPVIKQGWTDPDDMWEHDGKIGIYRVAKMEAQTNGRIERDANGNKVFTRVPNKAGTGTKRGPPKYQEGFGPGWLRLVDCNMDGKFYHDLMKDKVFPAAAKYFGKYTPQAVVDRRGERRNRLTKQEDGAGGHGLGRGESEWHKAMVEMANKLGIDVVTQTSSSPEMNTLDLGFWWALESRVCQRYRNSRRGGTKTLYWTCSTT